MEHDLDRVLERLRESSMKMSYYPDREYSYVRVETVERILRDSWPQPATGEREAVVLWLKGIAATKSTDDRMVNYEDTQLAKRAIAALLRESPPSWVPVSEKLPQNQRVLVHSEEGEFTAWFVGGWQQPLLSSRVTHWMPLPAPPQEVTP